MLRSWWKLLKDSRGQDMIEYALLCGLAAASGGFALPQIVSSFQPIYDQVSTELTAAGGSASSGTTTTTPPAAPPPPGQGNGGHHDDH